MKYILFISFFLINVFGYAQSQLDPLNVLFVGNSLTFFNNIPQTFKAIAEEQGYYINLDQHTPGGTGFVDHITNEDLYAKLDNTVWDYVILQPGTAESLELEDTIEVTISRAQQLRDKIYENSPCASIYLYETSYVLLGSSEGALLDYLNTQLYIRNNLIEMSSQLNLPLVPVGESFQTAIQQYPEIFLWMGFTDIHQNEKGAFLAACTFYNALFQKSILNSVVNSTLSIDEANIFRNVAENVTLNNLGIWNIDTLTANANFTFNSSDGLTVNFINTSSNFNGVLWNFGDGTSSSEINPTHEFDFTVQNNYQVYLNAYLDCKESYYNQTISPSILNIDEFSRSGQFIVYPNPVFNDLNLVSQSDLAFSYNLYDLYGKIVIAEDKISTNHAIETSNLDKGYYLVKVISGKQVKTKKIIKL